MNIFKVGEVILQEKIAGEKWIFSISDVFHLSEEEYAKNEEFNDTLGNYDPENEKPTNSVATIKAVSVSGDTVTLKWSSGIRRVQPHTSKLGWSKSLFVKLNVELQKWSFGNA